MEGSSEIIYLLQLKAQDAWVIASYSYNKT